MPVGGASSDIERRVTAWHEAGHLVATLVSRNFDINDAGVDFRSSPRGKAFAAVKKLSGPALLTVEEAQELYAIALGGRIAEEALKGWSREAEGRTIYPDETGASTDLAWARGLVAHHQFDEAQLETQARDRLAGQLEAIVELGDSLWRSNAEQVTRLELMAIPVVASLHARKPKATVVAAPAADKPIVAPGAPATTGGLWTWLLRLIGWR